MLISDLFILQVNVWDYETMVDPKFTLFLTTQISNPVFSPEFLTATVLIDFNVTVKGLEDQLLARVVSMEHEVSIVFEQCAIILIHSDVQP